MKKLDKNKRSKKQYFEIPMKSNKLKSKRVVPHGDKYSVSRRTENHRT